MSDEKMKNEEAANEENGNSWTEEFTVAANEAGDFVKGLLKEATVRRVIVQTADGRRLLDLPVWMGVTGILVWPTIALMGVFAGMVTNCSILVERQAEATG